MIPSTYSPAGRRIAAVQAGESSGERQAACHRRAEQRGEVLPSSTTRRPPPAAATVSVVNAAIALPPSHGRGGWGMPREYHPI